MTIVDFRKRLLGHNLYQLAAFQSLTPVQAVEHIEPLGFKVAHGHLGDEGAGAVAGSDGLNHETPGAVTGGFAL